MKRTAKSKKFVRIARNVAVGVLLSHAALADKRTEARSHFRRGMDSIAQGKYEFGINELQKAYELLPHPDVVYNIARAYAESGDLENSVVYFRKYLQEKPGDADVEKIIRNLEARIVRQKAALEAAQTTEKKPADGDPKPTEPGSATDPAPPGNPSVEAPKPGDNTAAKPAEKGKPTLLSVEEFAKDLGVGKAKSEDAFSETVVTASRGAQSPLDAPASVSIITEQDIQLSDITKIPELLRRLAGVDVMQTTGSQTEVSIRGFNARLSARTLVLINGRSVYFDLLGATFWENLWIGVEDIERIEVVRGPGSALYGADAFNGVINIITKTPGEGTSGARFGFGDRLTTHASIWATGKRDKFSWRTSFGYDYLPRWSREVGDNRADLKTYTPDLNVAARTLRADVRGVYKINPDMNVDIGGGMNMGSNNVQAGAGLDEVSIEDTENSQIYAQFNSKSFTARTFWNRYSANFGLSAAPIGQSLLNGIARTNVIDVEAQYVGDFQTGKGFKHDLHVGAGYRFKQVDWTYLDQERIENHASVFLHDKLDLGSPKVAIIGDFRLDYVPYLKRVVPSPRLSGVYHPTEKSTVRASFATAFRKPTFLQTYIDFPVQIPILNAASQRLKADAIGLVDTEKVLSAEIGYQTQEADWISFDSSIFYNHVYDLIVLSSPRGYTPGDIAAGNPFNGQAGLYDVAYNGYENECQKYNSVGAEVGARTFPMEGLDVYGNLTVQKVFQDQSKCSALQRAQLLDVDRAAPVKLNVGVQLRTKKGFDGSIDGHLIASQTWSDNILDVQTRQFVSKALETGTYFILNARVGYRFLNNQAEISLAGYNLLSENRQYPLGQIVGRRVMGLFAYRF